MSELCSEWNEIRFGECVKQWAVLPLLARSLRRRTRIWPQSR